jgi:hypothetical protein
MASAQKSLCAVLAAVFAASLNAERGRRWKRRSHRCACQVIIGAGGGNRPSRAGVFVSHGQEAERIGSRLDKHVSEFLEGAPWMPLHHTLGISGYEACFNHPAEMFYALSIAKPVLSADTGNAVEKFLAAQLRERPPYAVEGFDNKTGRARESYDVPTELRMAGRGKASHAFGVYAFWAYCH